MSTTAEAKSLRILIAGAGIGGLSAAISLRHAGHHVEVFESSRFAVELGAAIHLPPNVNGLLRRFGIKPEEFRCNDAEFVTVYDSQGNVASSKDIRNLRQLYPYPWQLSHRIDLHEALKNAATTPNGPGCPVQIHLRSRVVDCDFNAPSLTLEDGSVIAGDLLIGADGVHSVLRPIIAQEDVAPTPSGGSAFRFLIPVSKVKENPETRGLLARPGELQLWDGTYRRLVIYPCRNNTELNFVCLHPGGDSKRSTEGWNNAASLEQVLRVYDEFCPAMKALLGMVNPDEIKLWRLLDRPALKTWISGKACLLGDAAHPFLPHQGQGGAQAIEDGAALGALFPLGTTSEEVQERLKLYMKCRYDRATMLPFKTSADDSVGGTSTDPLEFSRINFGHDAYEYASNVLRKSAPHNTLATMFGPLKPPSPANNLHSQFEITFRTRRTYLETFLPNIDSLIQAMGGWATASVIITHLDKGYTRVALSIPNALLTGGSGQPEIFTPVIFDNDVDSLINQSQQVQEGPLRCYADIREYTLGDRVFVTVGRGGHAFLGVSISTACDEKGDAEVAVSRFSADELRQRFRGIAHVVERIQGLDIFDVRAV